MLPPSQMIGSGSSGQRLNQLNNYKNMYVKNRNAIDSNYRGSQSPSSNSANYNQSDFVLRGKPAQTGSPATQNDQYISTLNRDGKIMLQRFSQANQSNTSQISDIY